MLRVLGFGIKMGLGVKDSDLLSKAAHNHDHIEMWFDAI